MPRFADAARTGVDRHAAEPIDQSQLTNGLLLVPGQQLAEGLGRRGTPAHHVEAASAVAGPGHGLVGDRPHAGLGEADYRTDAEVVRLHGHAELAAAVIARDDRVGRGYSVGSTEITRPRRPGGHPHGAGACGEDRVVAAQTHALTGLEARAALAHDDLPAGHGLAGEHLYAEALGVGVAPVAARSEALLMRHPSPPPLFFAAPTLMSAISRRVRSARAP